MKRVLFIFASCLFLIGTIGCSNLTLNNCYTEISTENKDVPSYSNVSHILSKDTLSEEELLTIVAYVEHSDSGVKLIKKNNTYTSGWLELTITGCNRITKMDDIQSSHSGFLYEACLGIENGNWREYSLPTCILSDGSFESGWELLLVDISIYSHNAALVTNKPGYYDDPYLFRADSLLWLTDQRHIELKNYMSFGIDYFSEKGKFLENECCFRITPGDTVSFTVGFIISPEMTAGQFDCSQFRICNTTGYSDSVFIDLDLGGT